MAGRKIKKGLPPAPKKDRAINFRVTEEEWNYLNAEAKGKATVTDLLRSRVFGGGMRNHDILRQVAGLHSLGMSLRRLSEMPSTSQVQAEVQQVLQEARAAISRLSRVLDDR